MSFIAGPGLKPAKIETGTIASVNVRNLTVDWVSQYSGKQIPGIQIMAPYYHFSGGEGFTVVPEVGAICAVCFPSDDESPFVIGFISGPELLGAKSADLKQEVLDPGVETEEDMTAPESSTSTGSAEVSKSDATYRGRRPILNPGDMYWQGRDENFVVLRRGGVLQIGATNICQRVYLPIRNVIRDFCENWEMNTAAGSMAWSVGSKEKLHVDQEPTEFTLIAREFAQDKKASVKVSLGSLADAEKPKGAAQGKVFMELQIAPGQIDPTDGTVSGEPKYVIRLDKVGNTFSMQVGTRTVEIRGDDVLTVKGNQTISVDKDRTLTVKGNIKETVEGEYSITGSKNSKEVWSKIKSISASSIKLGSDNASEPAVLGLKLITWLANHTHAAPYALPVQAAQVAQLLSKKVLVE